MSTQRRTAGASVGIVNGAYCVISSAIDPGRDIVRGETRNRHPFSIDTPRSIMLDVHLLFQPQLVPHREHSGSITKTGHSEISRTLMLLLLLLLLFAVVTRWQ